MESVTENHPDAQITRCSSLSKLRLAGLRNIIYEVLEHQISNLIIHNAQIALKCEHVHKLNSYISHQAQDIPSNK